MYIFSLKKIAFGRYLIWKYKFPNVYITNQEIKLKKSLYVLIFIYLEYLYGFILTFVHITNKKHKFI